MNNTSFTHLHVHTQYSLLDGASKITDLVKKTKEYGMDSLAITDHGVMYGVVDFYKECIKEGIKPIIGCEVYVINGDILDKTKGRDEERFHLVLLAKDNEGYKNLSKLVSESHVNGFYYKPRVSKEILRKYSNGLIALSGCLSGEVAVNILRENTQNTERVINEYVDIFGKENFFLEMQCNTIDEQQLVNDEVRKLSERLGIDMVITNDIHYVDYEDYEVQDILMCIQTNKKVSDRDRMKMPTNDFYLKSVQEIKRQFPNDIEAMENTHKIAERCNVTFDFGKYKLPKFKMEKIDMTSYEYLQKLVADGINERYDKTMPEYEVAVKRSKYELDVINKMGFVDYFLIVWDFINFAKSNRIPVGPGRGSAAGSLVSYVLKIIEVDPLKYDLLFERFLNPERVSMPDIDIDFCYIRRNEVIDYVIKRYGKECVSEIITFGTMAAKAVIRDVGRVLDMPYNEVDVIAKMIPFELKMTIDKALEINKELKNLYVMDDKVKVLIDTSRKLEGLPRHASRHAAGIVICDKPVSEYVPLSQSDDIVVTQFNMITIEELGLLKMDFLGLRTLTVIDDTIKLVEENYGNKIDLLKLDYGVKEVYDMISKGKTSGIFQLESTGITTFLKELMPECLDDIIAGISLYRPGPMDYIPLYLKGKRNKDEIVYQCDELKEILESTYGTIVYQEQVMAIFRKLAGYSFGRSDLVRRAMSKKKMDVMLKEKEIFIYGSEEDNIDGCIKRGISEEVAEELYSRMIDFAKYAFNKSHSTCYAHVAYQTGYLKYFYPAEFFASLISSVMESQGKVSEYIYEAKSMGIKLMPPDINESRAKFTANKGEIKFSLTAIKGVGRDIIENLEREREKNGRFTSLYDFIDRMLNYNISKKAIENLIKVGAFTSLGGKRSQYLAIYMNVYDVLASKKRRSMDGQLDLFSLGLEEEEDDEILMPDVEEFTDNAMLAMEKELLGIYVTGHPLQGYERILNKYSNTKIKTLVDLDVNSSDSLKYDGRNVKIAGMIEHIRLKVTKSSSIMAFVTLEDMTYSLELLVFPNVYEKVRISLAEGNIIIISGKVNVKEDDGVQVVVYDVIELADLLVNEKDERLLMLDIDTLQDTEIIKRLEEILRRYEGDTGIEILVKQDMKVRTPKLKVNINEELIKELINLLGRENVKIKN